MQVLAAAELYVLVLYSRKFGRLASTVIPVKFGRFFNLVDSAAGTMS